MRSLKPKKQSRIKSAIERRVRGARFAEINTVDASDFDFDPGDRRGFRSSAPCWCQPAR
jgi:hypothetical protein